jgi:ribonucleoside-triphosphate reductase
MREVTDRYTREEEKPFGICQSPSVNAQHRLATIDRKTFRGRFIAQGESSDGSLYYSTGSQVQATADVPLEERIEIEARFHPKLDGGAVLDVWMDGTPSPEVVFKRVRDISGSEVSIFGFTRDLTLCMSCGTTSGGLNSSCPSCGAGKIDWVSRFNGEVGRVGIGEEIGGWNRGARKQLLSRRRYSL